MPPGRGGEGGEGAEAGGQGMGETSAAEQQPSRQAVDVSAAEPSAAEPSGGGRVSSPQGGGSSTARAKVRTNAKAWQKQMAGTGQKRGEMRGLAHLQRAGGMKRAFRTTESPDQIRQSPLTAADAGASAAVPSLRGLAASARSRLTAMSDDWR